MYFRERHTARTPLHEHYHPETGDFEECYFWMCLPGAGECFAPLHFVYDLGGAPQGVPHFSWTAAHLLMWVDEGNKTSSALAP